LRGQVADKLVILNLFQDLSFYFLSTDSVLRRALNFLKDFAPSQVVLRKEATGRRGNLLQKGGYLSVGM